MTSLLKENSGDCVSILDSKQRINKTILYAQEMTFKISVKFLTVLMDKLK
jgi:hypothetical protein